MAEVLKVDPRVDFVVKRIFNKQHLLLSLIQSVLEPDGVHVEKIESLTTIDDRHIKCDKTIIFDAHVQFQDGSRSIIEIQVYVPNWTGDRIVYNWSRGFVKMLGIGEDYRELKPLYSIWILGENLFDDVVPVHHFRIYDQHAEKLLSDKLQIYTIELKKGPGEDTIESALERWMCFFQRGRYYDPKNPPETLRTGPFIEAFQIMYEITQEERDWATYEQEHRYLRAEITRKHYEETLLVDMQKAVAELKRAEEAQKRAEEALHYEEVARKLAEDARQQEALERKRAEQAREQEALERKRAEQAREQEALERKRAEDRIQELETLLKAKKKQP